MEVPGIGWLPANANLKQKPNNTQPPKCSVYMIVCVAERTRNIALHGKLEENNTHANRPHFLSLLMASTCYGVLC
eukprot:3944356-Amphidinium_carterae.1